ncbi:hypothetical protein ACFV0G_39300, partial [Kitasatospora sp. NPDC059571]
MASRSRPSAVEAALNPFRTTSGRPVPCGPQVSTWHEALTAVARGRAVTTVAGELCAWPDLVFLPVVDAPPSRRALVRRTSRESDLIRAFARSETLLQMAWV